MASKLHAALAVGGFLVFAVLTRICKAVLTPLRSVPGPFLARFTRLWYLRRVSQGAFEKVNIDLHRRYGPVVRIAPNEYSIDDPAAIKTIYGHGSSFVKAPWYRASGNPDPNITNLFTDENTKRHAENRKKVAGLYSMSSLVQYEPYVTESVQLLLTRFEELSGTGKAVNMQHWLQCMAFDAIAQLTFAHRFGFLDTGEDQQNLLSSIHQYLIYCANVGVIHEWHPFIYKLLNMMPKKGGAGYMVQFSSEQMQRKIDEAKNGESSVASRGDFLTKLYNMHCKDPEKIPLSAVFMTSITNIGAGSDTTSISLAAIMYHLIRNPACLEKLREELDAMTTESQDLNDTISFADAQKMPYLQACIKEGLRLHPATGLPLARVVPKGGAFLCGRHFPEGTVVGVNAWVANRNQDVFGKDADDFRPERWLESAETASAMERNFLSFGAGSRTCIGKNISLLEISKLIPELVRRFDFQLAEPFRELETQNVWFVKQKNFFCRITMREK